MLTAKFDFSLLSVLLNNSSVAPGGELIYRAGNCVTIAIFLE